ncbi:MlaD family protein [Nocardia sp. CA2R105]|uniref:MlaD family protein n=1 Tax=Nocardia coffeae TaxID=2873381 RepID=UPI001CA6B7D9|nr:MlaD family protein [Nocardia coffeae]MBY8859971.1 MlaD family protein [Nocardia coffeae]
MSISAVFEPPARVLVSGTRAMTRHRLLTSMVGLALVFVLGAGYLLLGSLKIDPLHSQYQVRVELAQSGGLLPNQDVTLRGVPVGRVQSVSVNGDKVVAVAAIDDGVHIPVGGDVRVAALSAAGEQYLDFLPTTDKGPYLTDGAVVDPSRTTTPVPLATLLDHLNGPLQQMDPAKLKAIESELGVGPKGPEKLSAILDGGMFMLSTLDSVLPQTVSLLHNSKSVLTMMSQVSPGLRVTSRNLAETMAGVGSMTGGYRTMVNTLPGMTTSIDQVIADNSPTMVQLLGNLTTTAQMAYVHIPALNEFFWPQQRAGSALDAISSAFHDGGVWAEVAIYPRSTCDYNVPRLPGRVPDSPEPYLNVRCTDPAHNPVRGASNAPRPPGDNTATAPPGSNPLQTSDPTPTGPLSIPTPYGGPHAAG